MLPIPKAVSLPEHKPSPGDNTEQLDKTDSLKKKLANLKSPPILCSFTSALSSDLATRKQTHSLDLNLHRSSLQTQILPRPLLPVHWRAFCPALAESLAFHMWLTDLRRGASPPPDTCSVNKARTSPGTPKAALSCVTLAVDQCASGLPKGLGKTFSSTPPFAAVSPKDSPTQGGYWGRGRQATSRRVNGKKTAENTCW